MVDRRLLDSERHDFLQHDIPSLQWPPPIHRIDLAPGGLLLRPSYDFARLLVHDLYNSPMALLPILL